MSVTFSDRPASGVLFDVEYAGHPSAWRIVCRGVPCHTRCESDVFVAWCPYRRFAGARGPVGSELVQTAGWDDDFLSQLGACRTPVEVIALVQSYVADGWLVGAQ